MLPIRWFLAGWLATAVVCAPRAARCDEPQPAVAAGDVAEQMESWWVDLAREEPFASHALLEFSRRPPETIAFLKQHLQPLAIEADRVRDLLDDLGSDDENLWKPAYEMLDYLDPRIAIDLETLMDEVQEAQARTRLVELLSGRERESLKGQTITLSKLDNGEYYNFRSQQGSWWAEHKVARLRSGGWGNRKRPWERAVRAVVLLDFFDTPESRALVEAMASGCPDAEPTAVAQGVLDARQAEGR